MNAITLLSPEIQSGLITKNQLVQLVSMGIEMCFSGEESEIMAAQVVASHSEDGFDYMERMMKSVCWDGIQNGLHYDYSTGQWLYGQKKGIDNESRI